MRKETRVVFNAYSAQIASLNGVDTARESFNVEPTIAQKLEDKVQESSAFLKKVNVIPVDEIKGQVLGLGTNAPIAGRTDTSGAGERTPTYVGELTPREYECRPTNFDTYMPYQILDAWAKFPDFQIRMRNKVIEQIGRDRLMIGFNGTSAAATTNKTINPLLQDVNIGWNQNIRLSAPERVMDGVKVGALAGRDYRNFDAMVYDAVNSLIEPWHRGDTGIVAIVGDGLVTEKYMALLDSDAADAPTEKSALATLLANISLGGKRVEQVPFFPARSILLTRVDNLSIYPQNGSYRRMIEDQPKKNRIVDWLSMNESYVIEDMGACCLIENIILPDETGADWEA